MPHLGMPGKARYQPVPLYAYMHEDYIQIRLNVEAVERDCHGAVAQLRTWLARCGPIHRRIDYLAVLWDRITTPLATLDVLKGHREVIAEHLRDLDSTRTVATHRMSSRHVFESV